MGKIKSVHRDASCEVCGNNHAECFEVHLGGERHIFDSFECAMRALTPRCGHCGAKLTGHGIVLGNTIYCSYQCANDDSVRERESRIILQQRAHL